MIRLLKLQHHRHSGRLLPHHQTSYRALGLLLLFGGAMLLTFSRLQHITSAEELFVNATVPAKVPTQPAVITDPPDNSSTTHSITPVAGTCEVVVPTTGIVIYRNGTAVASVPCEGDGTFALTVPLSPGANTLIARSVTITGGYGPDSQPVHITYLAPTTPSAPSTSTPTTQSTRPNGSHSGRPAKSSSVANTRPLVITADNPYLVFSPQKQAEWSGTISGGNAPYTVQIAWGDGTVDTVHKQTSGHHSYAHQYILMTAHIMRISVTDEDGKTISVPFAAITSYTGPNYTTQYDGKDPIDMTLYIIFGLSVCVVLLLWLRSLEHAEETAKTRNRNTRKRRKR